MPEKSSQTKVIIEQLELTEWKNIRIPYNLSSKEQDQLLHELESKMEHMFNQLGGIATFLKEKKAVYIKPNGIDAKPYAYTRPEVLEALIHVLQNAGAPQIYVFENSTQSNYTRIVFEATGYHKVCKRTGAKPIYLDEESVTLYNFRKDGNDYDSNCLHLSRTVVDQLITHRAENLYINLPKLKTHSMSGVTLGIKNQWAFPEHADRSFDHNFRLHAKLVDVLRLIQPDITVIDGIEGTIHGHYPPTALIDESVVSFRVLVGGTNVFATDLVGAKIFGLTIADVPHFQIALKQNLTGNVKSMEDIEIIGDLSKFTTRYSYDIFPQFPPDVNIVGGSELWCKEGCQNNPLMLLQVLYLDYGGHGKFDFVAGKGFDPDQIARLEGPVLICGHCAMEEVGEHLISRLGKRKVYYSDGCNNLAQTAAAMLRLLHVNPLKLVPINPLKSILLLAQAKLHRTKANVPSVFAKWIKMV